MSSHQSHRINNATSQNATSLTHTTRVSWDQIAKEMAPYKKSQKGPSKVLRNQQVSITAGQQTVATGTTIAAPLQRSQPAYTENEIVQVLQGKRMVDHAPLIAQRDTKSEEFICTIAPESKELVCFIDSLHDAVYDFDKATLRKLDELKMYRGAELMREHNKLSKEYQARIQVITQNNDAKIKNHLKVLTEAEKKAFHEFVSMKNDEIAHLTNTSNESAQLAVMSAELKHTRDIEKKHEIKIKIQQLKGVISQKKKENSLTLSKISKEKYIRRKQNKARVKHLGQFKIYKTSTYTDYVSMIEAMFTGGYEPHPRKKEFLVNNIMIYKNTVKLLAEYTGKRKTYIFSVLNIENIKFVTMLALEYIQMINYKLLNHNLALDSKRISERTIIAAMRSGAIIKEYFKKNHLMSLTNVISNSRISRIINKLLFDLSGIKSLAQAKSDLANNRYLKLIYGIEYSKEYLEMLKLLFIRYIIFTWELVNKDRIEGEEYDDNAIYDIIQRNRHRFDMEDCIGLPISIKKYHSVRDCLIDNSHDDNKSESKPDQDQKSPSDAESSSDSGSDSD